MIDFYILSTTMTAKNYTEDDENLLGEALVKLIDLLLEIEADNPKEFNEEN